MIFLRYFIFFEIAFGCENANLFSLLYDGKNTFSKPFFANSMQIESKKKSNAAGIYMI
jgi:hypothetical protein